MEIELNARSIARWLIAVMICLLCADMATEFARVVLGHDYVFGLVRQFQLGGEGNIPTWYSSVALGLCAMLLSLIAFIRRRQGDRFGLHWTMLAVIFAFLSCDEVAQIHEQFVEPLQLVVTSAYLRYVAWVLVYAPLLAIFLVAFFRFFRALPSRHGRWFLVSGALYVMGALGMELITSAYGTLVPGRPLHWLFNATEEGLEMSGAIAFCYTLLVYAGTELGEMRVRVSGMAGSGTHRA